MKIHLKINNDGQVSKYSIEGLKTHNRLFFVDPVYPSTTVELTLNTDSIVFVRKGQVKMKQHFILDKPTVGEFIDEHDIKFELRILTTKLWIFPCVFQIDYILQINGECPTKMQMEAFFPD